MTKPALSTASPSRHCRQREYREDPLGRRMTELSGTTAGSLGGLDPIPTLPSKAFPHIFTQSQARSFEKTGRSSFDSTTAEFHLDKTAVTEDKEESGIKEQVRGESYELSRICKFSWEHEETSWSLGPWTTVQSCTRA